MSETVLTIQNSLLQPHLAVQGCGLISENKEQVFQKIIENQTFMPRDDAEYNFEHKQIIPYVVVRCRDSYLLLKRLKKQTEKRLHNMLSLGIGGHVNPDASVQGDNIIMKGLYRELNEEVQLGQPDGLDFIGVINDERNSVSKVHLGLLYILEVGSPEYRVLEPEKMTAHWVGRDEMGEYYDKLETWSQIVYDQYIKTGVNNGTQATHNPCP